MSGDALEAVGPRKQARVIRTARLYLAEGGGPAATSYRFDVIAVTFYEDEQRPPRVVHIARAFETT